MSPTSTSKPHTVDQALSDPIWKATMMDEYDTLVQNKTWHLISFCSLVNPLTTKWIFRNKYNPDGTIERHKARLMAKGFNQNPGRDFIDTFNLFVKPSTIKVIFSLAVSHGWDI